MSRRKALEGMRRRATRAGQPQEACRPPATRATACAETAETAPRTTHRHQQRNRPTLARGGRQGT